MENNNKLDELLAELEAMEVNEINSDCLRNFAWGSPEPSTLN